MAPYPPKADDLGHDMQILLTNNVEKLGKIGEIVSVADGYARNYLFPKRLATLVNPANVKELELRRRKQEAKERKEREDFGKLAEGLSGLELSIAVKATEEGRLFGSITPAQIVEELSRRGYNLEEKVVIMKEHIKECGNYEVTLSLHPGVQTLVKLSVVRES